MGAAARCHVLEQLKDLLRKREDELGVKKLTNAGMKQVLEIIVDFMHIPEVVTRCPQ